MTHRRRVLLHPLTLVGGTLRDSRPLFGVGLVSGGFIFGMNILLSRFFGLVTAARLGGTIYVNDP